jgi:hypothetical protein
MQYPIAERDHTINGVPGRMCPIHAPQQVRGRLVHRSQKWISEGRPVKGYGTNGVMYVEMRFDDQCGNGYQNFAITARVYTKESRRKGDIAAGGCLHEEIEKTFPELAPFIRWHLVGTDGPMHYLGNTIYHAGDRDYNGRRKGEPCAWDYGVRFGNSPITHRIGRKFWEWLQARIAHNANTPKSNPHRLGEFRPVAIDYEKTSDTDYKFKPKYTLAGWDSIKWHECPFDDATAAQEFADALNSCPVKFVKIATDYSEGKDRDFDAARRCALWPDATDEELSAEPETLKAALLARLPGLMAEFRAAMENAGFLWEPEQPENAE